MWKAIRKFLPKDIHGMSKVVELVIKHKGNIMKTLMAIRHNHVALSALSRLIGRLRQKLLLKLKLNPCGLECMCKHNILPIISTNFITEVTVAKCISFFRGYRSKDLRKCGNKKQELWTPQDWQGVDKGNKNVFSWPKSMQRFAAKVADAPYHAKKRGVSIYKVISVIVHPTPQSDVRNSYIKA